MTKYSGSRAWVWRFLDDMVTSRAIVTSRGVSDLQLHALVAGREAERA